MPLAFAPALAVRRGRGGKLLGRSGAKPVGIRRRAGRRGIQGLFHKFTATVDFAPDALASSRIDVQIDLNSVDSMDKDRDTTIRGTDIFDVAHSPTAHYVTRSITKTAAGYAAVGALTLRGVTKDVPIEFKFAPGAGAPNSTGRQAQAPGFRGGQGDWKSTEWVADAVKISFSLALKPKT